MSESIIGWRELALEGWTGLSKEGNRKEGENKNMFTREEKQENPYPCSWEIAIKAVWEQGRWSVRRVDKEGVTQTAADGENVLETQCLAD